MAALLLVLLTATTKRRTSQRKMLLYRADRVLANRTGKSRSECFQLLQQRRVWQLNGDDETCRTVLSGPSSKISMHQHLRIDQTVVVPLPPPLLLVYHKPKWVLSVTKDPHHHRPCLADDILPHQMHPVGRLDYDTSGLLLFSSSGALTQHLLHPKHGIEKEYVATVTGVVDVDGLRRQLQEGVETAEGVHTAVVQDVQHMPESRVRSYLDNVQAGLPAHYNQTDLRERGYLKVFQATALSTVRLTVTEGKHRMVRRMLANSGHPVVSLQRERFGTIHLLSDNTVPAAGETRELTPDELAWAESLLSSSTSKSSSTNKPKRKQKYKANPDKKQSHGRRRKRQRA